MSFVEVLQPVTACFKILNVDEVCYFNCLVFNALAVNYSWMFWLAIPEPIIQMLFNFYKISSSHSHWINFILLQHFLLLFSRYDGFDSREIHIKRCKIFGLCTAVISLDNLFFYGCQWKLFFIFRLTFWLIM